MSYHGSGIDEETYEKLRMSMFGQRLVSDWSAEELADKEQFIDWAMEEPSIMDDLDGDYSEEETRAMLSVVFDNEIRQMEEEAEEILD